MERELNILLIEDDPDTCRNFAEYIDTKNEVALTGVTNNSYRAIELVKEGAPDAVILDLELNEEQGNGLMFLQELEALSLPFKPYILVTTNNSSSTTYHFARKTGADFIMSKYQEDYSEKRAVDFLCMMKQTIQNTRYTPDSAKQASPSAPSNKQLMRLVSLELDAVGISPKAIGYQYLSDAVLLIMQGHPHNICSTLAKQYKKTDSSVERAMQNAINKAWRTTDIDDLLKHYTARINSDKGVPTLTEFIHYYANKIKNHL